jgi:putative DNA primase/helicase
VIETLKGSTGPIILKTTNSPPTPQMIDFKYTTFENSSALTKKEVTGSWADLVDLIKNPRKYPKKEACPWIKLATFGDISRPSGCLRHDKNVLTVTGIEGDYDGEVVSIEYARDTLVMFGVRAVLYTSASHTPNKPRWRVLLPLSHPHSPGERHALVARLNGLLGGVLATESFTLSQSYFYGHVEGTSYEAHETQGDYIDEIGMYDLGAIGPKSESPNERLSSQIADGMILPPITDEELTDLESAVMHLANAGHGDKYPDWASIGQALKAESINGRKDELKALWLKYSRTCKGFENDAAVEKKWEQLEGTKSGKPAVFRKAQNLGWENPKAARITEDDHAMSDVRISRKLAGVMTGQFLYEHGGRGWLIYEQGIWRACNRGEEVEAGKRVGLQILKGKIDNADDAKRTMGLAQRAMSATGISAALKLAQSDERLAARPDEFDKDRDLLNCTNGVVHLPTGVLRPHDPAARMARQCPFDYLPGTTPVRWLKFLEEISMNDPEWIDYLHRICGYILTGHVREEVLIFMLGFGANGKSVFANVLNKIMGSYAVSLPSAFLMVSSIRNGEAATPALAMLPGARLALANEVESGSRLSAQIVKVACSTEPIAARHMYGGVFSFVPTHKLVIRGNHKPIITDDDDGIWRRMRLLPFDRKFAPHERDMQLEEKLMAEASGILGWLVRGSMAYYQHGLTCMGRAAIASAAYRKESDLMAQWTEEETEPEPDSTCLQVEAYTNYRNWCGTQGLRGMCKKQFTDKLKERGFETGQQSTGSRARVYRGFRLTSGFSQLPSEQDLFQ